MGRKLDRCFAPAKLNVGMVAFPFGDRSDFVDERERFGEILEFEFLGDPAHVAAQGPIIELFQQDFRFFLIERCLIAFACDTFLFCEFRLAASSLARLSVYLMNGRTRGRTVFF